MDVLVDTSVWSLTLRRRLDVLNPLEKEFRDELHALVGEGRAFITGPVRQEVLSGIRETVTFDRLRDYLRTFGDIALATEDFEEAARYTNLCRAVGIAGSSVDFLTCAVATRRGWAILTTDPDFRRFSEHLPLILHSPRGRNS